MCPTGPALRAALYADTMPTLEALTEEQLGALDASYRPFPCFSAWPRYAGHVELWTRRLQRLTALQDSVNAVESDRARLIALRAAAFDTGAIEGLYSTNRGLTWSVATQAAAWERTLVEESPDARALFDAQLRTYELALDAATQRLPLSEALVRRLHEELTAPQETYLVHTPVGAQEQPLPRGRYKKHPNHVRLAGGEAHAYAPVLDTASEMHRLIEELEHPEFRQAHSIIQAAYAHYCLVGDSPLRGRKRSRCASGGFDLPLPRSTGATADLRRRAGSVLPEPRGSRHRTASRVHQLRGARGALSRVHDHRGP